MDYIINSTNTLTGRYQYSTNHNWADDVIKGESTDSKYTQQNLGLTLTHIFNNTQTGEVRLGAGRRETIVSLADGDNVPVLRFSPYKGALISPYASTIMGNAGAYPIKRFQTDWQLVYNHYWQVSPKVTLKFGTDLRPGQLNDMGGANIRGTRFVSDNNQVCNSKTSDCYHDPYWFFQRGEWGYQGSYSRSYGQSELANKVSDYNFFVQADMRLPRPLL
jgi:hypothetical protein